MKELILVTAGFPFGMGETFLETEVKYLAKGFDKVTILAINPSSETQRSLPENCHATPLHIQVGSKEKLRALRFLFTGLFWKELKVIHKTYKMRLTKGMINTMLISLYRASTIKNYLENSVNKNEQVFYSYWCDDAALALALLKKNLPSFKAISRIHRWDVYFEESTLSYLPYRHFITRQLNKIFSISEDGINYAVKRWKVDRKNFSLSRLGIESKGEISHLNKECFTIVSCSNLIPVKRVDLLAKAVVQLKGKAKLRWIHIGDGTERYKIDKIIKDVDGSISIEMPGRLPNLEVFELYRKERPDLFVNVSSSEGIPVSIMEAMSFGIPCIATNVGGNSEIVNERNGKLLAENPTPQEIVDAICAFFETTVFQLKSEGAFLTWEEKYNGERNYSDFVGKLSLF
ncbi:MAG: glycosyltransferase [Bacteroidota bacterium]